ncbi:hypothetical protein CP556_12330 [Natrinema sp. CBA1119]|nr:hypothetical protein CP556_12330 [Natrinema sp. CBA1119]
MVAPIRRHTRPYDAGVIAPSAPSTCSRLEIADSPPRHEPIARYRKPPPNATGLVVWRASGPTGRIRFRPRLEGLTVELETGVVS